MTVSEELALLLIGAGIALVSGVIGAFLQHCLSLKADRIKRDRDREEREAKERRQVLLQGARTLVRSARHRRIGHPTDEVFPEEDAEEREEE